MKACKGSRGMPSIISNAGLDRGEWSVSRLGRFYLRLVEHQSRSGRSRVRKIISTCPDSNPGSSWPQLVAMPSALHQLPFINPFNAVSKSFRAKLPAEII
jgi:hypothetical protein